MTDHSTPSAPVVDPADATPGARPWGPNGEPVSEPAAGDDQRRCWTMLGNSDGTGSQCLLFNGHGGEHQWRRADDMQEELARYGGLIAIARDAHRQGLTVHLGRQDSCEANATADVDEKRLAVALRQVMAEPTTGDAIFAVGRGKWDEFAVRVGAAYRAWRPVGGTDA